MKLSQTTFGKKVETLDIPLAVPGSIRMETAAGLFRITEDESGALVIQAEHQLLVEPNAANTVTVHQRPAY